MVCSVGTRSGWRLKDHDVPGDGLPTGDLRRQAPAMFHGHDRRHVAEHPQEPHFRRRGALRPHEQVLQIVAVKRARQKISGPDVGRPAFRKA
jgi:hypothetical protein